MILEARGLGLGFDDGAGRRIEALCDVSACFSKGEIVAITGPSGSGKSTLLHVLAGLLRPQTGAIFHDGRPLLDLDENARDSWRRQAIGLVFQGFHLIEEMSAEDNVVLAAHFTGFTAKSFRPRARDLLMQLGVPASRGAVSRFSRGEQQRVALARALIFDPPILLADEPTASLDEEAGQAIGHLLADFAHQQGRIVVVASHDPTLIRIADRRLALRGGTIASSLDEAAAAPPSRSAS